jgi:MFS family permease
VRLPADASTPCTHDGFALPSSPRDGGRSRSAQALIVGASFSLLFVGSNAANPLLPLYRAELGLDPLAVSAVYVLYVAVLAASMLVLARERFTRFAPALLIAGLLVAVVSDLLMAHMAGWSLMTGRVTAGVAAGLATGASAALVVAAVGARGRALAATGNLVGAVIGSSAAQVAASVIPDTAPETVFLVHAGLVALMLIAAVLVLRVRRGANRAALDLRQVPAAPRVTSAPERPPVRWFVVGSITWVAISLVIAFGASLFAEIDRPVVQAVGPTLLLVASASAQLGSNALARVAPWMSGNIAMSAGAVALVAGALTGSTPLALASFAALGFGIGLSFRLNLVVLTRGASPSRQGALTSLYTAITYAASGSVVLGAGLVGNVIGLVPAALGTMAVVAVATALALIWAPRLRDASEPAAS